MQCRARLGILALTSGLLTLASDVSSAGPQTSAKPAAIRACSLLTREEVKKIVGGHPDPTIDKVFDKMPLEEDSLAGGGSSCGYPSVHIQINPFPFSTIDDMRKKDPSAWTTVSGVGDAAYLRNNRDEWAELFARAGKHVVTIQLDLEPPRETLEKARPAASALAQALIAKLPK